MDSSNIMSNANQRDLENMTKTSHDYHENIAVEGYVTDITDDRSGNVKTAVDGHTVLIPQPSDDPRDPLNWSSVRKHVILFIIGFAAFLPDYGSATGAVTLLPQARSVSTKIDLVIF